MDADVRVHVCRLLAELAKLGAQTVNATQADIVPLDEPRDRLESLVDVNVELVSLGDLPHLPMLSLWPFSEHCWQG